MNIVLKTAGWTMRASAAICITWILVGVFRGQIATVPALLQSVAFHGVFALAGAQLCGFAKRGVGQPKTEAAEA